jgi:hypothetical protein
MAGRSLKKLMTPDGLSISAPGRNSAIKAAIQAEKCHEILEKHPPFLTIKVHANH